MIYNTLKPNPEKVEHDNQISYYLKTNENYNGDFFIFAAQFNDRRQQSTLYTSQNLGHHE